MNIIKPSFRDDTIAKMKNDTNIKKHVLKETQQSFAVKVEDLVWDKDISYFDAIHIIMEENNYEPEYIAKLLTGDLYTKLSEEAEQLSLIKKTNRLDL